MAPSKNPAPRAAHSAPGTAAGPAPAPVAPAAGGSPAAAVLAALSAHPAGAAVAVIAAQAAISVPAARQALTAHEKAGAATRIKGGRPGIPDTWTPAAPPAEAPPAPAPPAPPPVPSSTAGSGQPSDAGPGPVPDPVAEAATGNQALAQAAGTAGKALAAGDLPAALTALEAARDQATMGRRAVKAAAAGRHTPAARPGALRELVEAHLRKFPGTAFTPHQIGKVLARSSGAVANALDRLVSLGTAQMATDKPRSYQLAPAAPAAGGPGTSAEVTPSAA